MELEEIKLKAQVDYNQQLEPPYDASVSLYIDGLPKDDSGVDCSFNIWGYGNTKEEAILNLQKALDFIQAELKKVNWNLEV